MADAPDLTEMFRRAVQANVKFYQGWLDLSLEYMRGLSDIVTGSEGGGGEGDAPRDPVGGGVLVVEGEEASEAGGAFLVTNDLTRPVTCQLDATPFADADGNVVKLGVAFEPAKFDLRPGEQRVVRAAVRIDRKLQAGYAYQGEFAIKGMEGLAIPVVVRRRHRSDDLVEVPAKEPPAAGKGTTSKATARKTVTKKAATKKKATAGKRAPKKRVVRQKN